jgi:hypothetical protein
VDRLSSPSIQRRFDLKELVDSIIKDLVIGEGVHWATIKEALCVPPYRCFE